MFWDAALVSVSYCPQYVRSGAAAQRAEAISTNDENFKSAMAYRMIRPLRLQKRKQYSLSLVKLMRSKWEAALYEGFILYINLQIGIIFRWIAASADWDSIRMEGAVRGAERRSAPVRGWASGCQPHAAAETRLEGFRMQAKNETSGPRLSIGAKRQVLLVVPAHIRVVSFRGWARHHAVTQAEGADWCLTAGIWDTWESRRQPRSPFPSAWTVRSLAR